MNMKIAVLGLGYVGLSNAALLAQHHDVVGVDLDAGRVEAVNAGKSPIQDSELSAFLARDDLNISASTDATTALKEADVVIVATPTDYDPKTNYFNTSSVDGVVEAALACQ